MPVFVTCKFDGDWIHSNWEKMETSFSPNEYKSMEKKKFCTQGRITPKLIIRSSPNSNSFKLLCLSSLPASLTIWSKMTEKSWRHNFFHCSRVCYWSDSAGIPRNFMWKKFLHSRVNNSKWNNPIRPNFKLLQAFMPLQVTCKFDKDPIKGDWEKLKTSFFSPLKGM